MRFGTVASYTWDFGDGSAPVTTTGPTTSHTYAKAGVYEVKVTATSRTGRRPRWSSRARPSSATAAPAATATVRVAAGILCRGQVPTIVGTDGDDTLEGTTATT